MLEAGDGVSVVGVFSPVLPAPPTERERRSGAGEGGAAGAVAPPAVQPPEAGQLSGRRPQTDRLHREPHGGLHRPAGPLPEEAQAHHGLHAGQQQHPERHQGPLSGHFVFDLTRSLHPHHPHDSSRW